MIRVNPQRGYILLPVVLLITLVATSAFLLNNESALDAGVTTSNLEAEQVEAVAQAGLNHALWQTGRQGCGPYTDLTNLSLDNHSYSTALTTDLGSTSSYTIAVDQDTWIRSDQPTVNKASDPKLHIRFEGGTIERPMYRYDLSSIAANASILSATAWFYVSKEHSEGPVDIHLLNADWTETDATWDSMGANMDTAVQATIPTQPTAGVWVAVNLTSQVQAWVNGQSNYGITLNSISEGTHGDYASREAGQQPYLEVIVGTPPSSSATLKSVGTLATNISRTITREAIRLYQQSSHRMVEPGAVNTDDAWITGTKTSWNYGGSNLLNVNENGGPQRGIVRFDLSSSIPLGARVTSATLEMFAPSVGGTGFVRLYGLQKDWVEGACSGGCSGAVTWDTTDGSNAWSTPGSDADVAAVAEVQAGNSNIWYSWDITSIARQWISGERPNFGLLIKGEGADVVFNSSDNANVSTHPKLTVTYNCECGQACIAPQGAGTVALIGDYIGFSPDPWDKEKEAIIESWGYDVDIHDDSFIWAINFNNYDVVYVSETAASASVNTQLTNENIGIVNEQGNLNVELQLAGGKATAVGNAVDIVDNSHYITNPFPTGDIPIYSADMELLTVTTPLAPGLQTLADVGGTGSLVALDKGAQLTGGGNAAGRRVTLPLGRSTNSNFNWDYLNNNGRLMVQRAIQWGTGNLGAGSLPLIVLATESGANLGGLDFTDKDLAAYDAAIDVGALFFDGAAAGLAQDIDAVHVLANGHLLLSTINTTTLGGLTFENEDLVDYDLANNVATMVLDGSDHFVKGSTDISAVYVQDGGTLLLTNEYEAAIGVVSFEPNDIVAYDPVTKSATLFFDGDAVGLQEWIDAVFLLPNGHIVLSTDNNASLGGINFEDGDLIEYDPVSDTATLYFDEDLFSGNENVRAVHIGAGAGEVITGPIPLAHWKMDETGGTTAVDSEGDHDGTLVNGPAWASGQLDGALDFDGANDYVNVPHDDTLSLLDTITISAWINASSFGTTYQTIIAKDGGGAGSTFWFGTWRRELDFGFFAGGTYREVFTSGLNLQPGTWYHLAASFDNSTDAVILYVDGVPVHNGLLSFSPSAVNADVAIGRSPDGERWRGLLDDVRIYDTVLETTDIADLYAAAGGGGGGGSGPGIDPPPPGTCDGTFRDEFNSVSFGNNDGTLNWAGDWLEVGESDGPGRNDVRVRDDSGRYQLWLRDKQNGGEGAEREADLSGATIATLSFEYRRSGLDRASDYVKLEISSNGAAGPWTELARFEGAATDTTYTAFSQDISAYISAVTRIRLITSPTMGSTDTVMFDNIQIECRP